MDRVGSTEWGGGVGRVSGKKKASSLRNEKSVDCWVVFALDGVLGRIRMHWDIGV